MGWFKSVSSDNMPWYSHCSGEWARSKYSFFYKACSLISWLRQGQYVQVWCLRHAFCSLRRRYQVYEQSSTPLFCNIYRKIYCYNFCYVWIWVSFASSVTWVAPTITGPSGYSSPQNMQYTHPIPLSLWGKRKTYCVNWLLLCGKK